MISARRLVKWERYVTKREHLGGLLAASRRLIGFSRIWNGVHYPTDVISGAIIAIVVSAVVYKLFDRLVWSRRFGSWRTFPGNYSR